VLGHDGQEQPLVLVDHLQEVDDAERGHWREKPDRSVNMIVHSSPNRSQMRRSMRRAAPDHRDARDSCVETLTELSY
jgi:hypothetical protein